MHQHHLPQGDWRHIGLTVHEGPCTGQRATFDRDVIRIGSHRDNDLVLDDDRVAPHHAAIFRTSEGIGLRDLGSGRPTRFEARPIREVPLGEGGLFWLGRNHVLACGIDIGQAPFDIEGLVHSCNPWPFDLPDALDRIAQTPLPVLITGEAGTGRELLGRSLHQRTGAGGEPFAVYRCGSANPDRIEEELFGSERGTFSGRNRHRIGLFEQARGGTVLFEDPAALPLEIQGRVLRVMEQRSVRRRGTVRDRPLEARIVATSLDPGEAVAAGTFRADLYHRMSIVEIVLSPLRDRFADLPTLIERLLQTAPAEHRVRGVTPRVLAQLQRHRWPGNLMELRELVIGALPWCTSDRIDLRACALAVIPMPAGDGLRTDLLRGALPEHRWPLIDRDVRVLGDALVALRPG